MYWDNGYNGVHGFGLFDRTTCEVTQPVIIDAIMEGFGQKASQNSTLMSVRLYVSDSNTGRPFKVITLQELPKKAAPIL